MRCARMKRRSATGPPRNGAGSRRTSARLTRSTTVSIAPDRIVRRLMADTKPALARGISLVEDDDPEGWALVREVYPHTGSAAVVGFTGPPGAGKSTLIA